MPLIRWRFEPFILKHMSQVRVAVITNDFDATPVRVRVLFDGSRHPLEERRPATAGVELGGSCIKRRIAADAQVGAVSGILRAFALLQLELELSGCLLTVGVV